jgi:4-amino-4-deoxy-L-arabinose transferase-like glycosyltransferase
LINLIAADIVSAILVIGAIQDIFYLVQGSGIYFWRFSQKKEQRFLEMRNHNNNLRAKIISLFILLIALVLPRAFALGRFVAIDEVNWLHRSATFYTALMRNKWEDTYVNDSPGVITTWVGSLALRIAVPDYRANLDQMKTSYTAFESKLARISLLKPIYIIALSRAIMITLLIALLLVCFYYAQRLFGVFPSLMGFLIIALNPFFIALTRMSHLDAPQAIFMFLSILAFLTYLYRGKRGLDLVVSGAAGGLAFLSKLPGVFIVPTIGVVSIWDYFKTRFFDKRHDSTLTRISFWKLIRSLVIWALVFIVVYAALWPAMWVQPVETVRKVFDQSSGYASTIVEESNSDVEINPQRLDRRSLSFYLRYPVSYLWRTTPVEIIGLLLLLYAFISRIDVVKEEIFRRSVIGLLIFAIIYTVGMTLPIQNSEKYYAPVHIVMGLLAGLGWYSLSHRLSKSLHRFRGKYLQTAILSMAIIVQLLWVFRSFPYYYTFYNPMLGGLQKAAQTRLVGVGEGLDQAGLYLLSKPNSSQLQVMSWFGVGPLSYYFDGEVTPVFIANSGWTPELVKKLSEMDYLVTYIYQKNANLPPELFKLLEAIEPEHTITISGAEYAWIYKVSDLPLPDLHQ